MTRRQLSKFRRTSVIGESSGWRHRLQGRGGMVMLILAGLIVAAALWMVPIFWATENMAEANQRWNNSHWSDFDALERGWKSLPLLRPFQRGDEPEIKAFLESEPLVVAVFDRWEHRRLWLRDGDRLVPAAADKQPAQAYMDWVLHAEAAQRFDWNPPKELDPDFGKTASVVLLSDRWMVIKRWTPGEEAGERFVRLAVPSPSKLRMGLYREGDEERADLERQPWGAEPHRQTDPYRLVQNPINALLKTNAFGEGWGEGAIPPKAEADTILLGIRKQLYLARGACALFALLILLGFWLRHRARQRAILDADRMASLTHSLKTPLAVLKFRCDTLRLGRLDQDQADAELLKLGQEVDHLTIMIENGLRAIRGDAPSGPTQVVDAGWIREVVEDLRPAYEMDDRPLDLRLGPERARASQASLRAALLTLVENALLHGSGRVTVETGRHRRSMSITVRDEGEGLNAVELEVLGKPYQRIRKQGKEGFLHEGQGLGLSLLAQVAEREGWGLSFESAPGEGFSAQLELQRL